MVSSPEKKILQQLDCIAFIKIDSSMPVFEKKIISPSH